MCGMGCHTHEWAGRWVSVVASLFPIDAAEDHDHGQTAEKPRGRIKDKDPRLTGRPPQDPRSGEDSSLDGRRRWP